MLNGRVNICLQVCLPTRLWATWTEKLGLSVLHDLATAQVSKLNSHSFPSWYSSPLEEMATHFSILAWKIPWTEEPSRLQSIRLQRVRNNWAAERGPAPPPTKLISLFLKHTKLLSSVGPFTPKLFTTIATSQHSNFNSTVTSSGDSGHS